MTVERKYVMTRLGRGDYLLPSNDGRRLFRVAVYEDGPSHGLAEWRADRTVWGVWVWQGGETVDVSWDLDWSMISGGFKTRREATDWALKS